MQKNKLPIKRRLLALILIGLLVMVASQPVLADPHPGQSQDVVIIGGTTLNTNNICGFFGPAANAMGWTAGGCLPVTGPAGELGDFNFTAMAPAAVSSASLAPFDTAVLNVASFGMACDTNTLTSLQHMDLVNFVASGRKLIIYDSECFPGPVDYDWLPYSFATDNPGAFDAQGTLTISEDNFLSTLVGDPTCISADEHCIDTVVLGSQTDAVGDMNVMTTFDPNWCVDMFGTNVNNITGPVQTYAKFPAGTDTGLFIYNGLNMDYLGFNGGTGTIELRKVWVNELQQPFNPSNLPCGITVVEIALSPPDATNKVGEDHTVTATLKDLLNNKQPDILVNFEVISGPNAEASGTCSANADCTTDANGQVSFTYAGSGGVGTDEIEACFTDPAGNLICSQTVTKEWVEEDTTAPDCSLQAVLPGPPLSIEVFTQDTESGINQINVLEAINASVNIPAFSAGNINPVIVTAEKINQSQASQIQLEVFDVAGNVTICDPVIKIVIREKDKPVRETFPDIPEAESYVLVQNQNPGLTQLDIIVNGTKFKITALDDDEEVTIDVSGAMLPGDSNTIKLVARGKPGSSAIVIIYDGVFS